MRTGIRITCWIAAVSLVAMPARTHAAEPLNLEQLVTLVKSLDEAEVVERIEQNGIDFEASAASFEALTDAGASKPILEAVQKAAPRAKAAGKLVTYDDVKNMLAAGVPEAKAMELLGRSPTLFTLDAAQERELRGLGASDKLIAALKGIGRTPPQDGVEITHLAILLDCSGSMKEHTRDRQSKMEAAKAVLSDLVQRMPNGLGLTLLIYGHDANLRCQAVEVVQASGAMTDETKSELRTQIRHFQPAGLTPIALAIRTAGRELAKQPGGSGLILISDGKETCQGDPVAEIAALADRLPLVFGAQVVGFDVDAEGRDQLKAIAEAGGGQYYDAADAGQLAQAAEELIQRVDAQAVPPAIHRQRGALSGIIVKQITLEGFPAIEEVFVVEAGSDIYRGDFVRLTVQRSQEIGTTLAVPPGRYDIVIQPSFGRRLHLAEGIEVNDREVVTLEANRLVSAVRVVDLQIGGIAAPKYLYLAPHGTDPHMGSFSGWGSRGHSQRWEGYDRTVLATPGRRYDVVFEPHQGRRFVLEAGFEAQAGRLTIIGGKEAAETTDTGGKDQ